jgi:hypothetical protein
MLGKLWCFIMACRDGSLYIYILPTRTTLWYHKIVAIMWWAIMWGGGFQVPSSRSFQKKSGRKMQFHEKKWSEMFWRTGFKVVGMSFFDPPSEKNETFKRI